VCGTANEPQDKFCGECAAALETVPPPGAGASPSAGVAPGGAEGERKQLTVLFADVQGSMDLQENLDPEAWAEIMGRVVHILAEGVRRFGGTIDKFTGDGVMASSALRSPRRTTPAGPATPPGT
jgi:class 3 adenylate cyclase